MSADTFLAVANELTTARALVALIPIAATVLALGVLRRLRQGICYAVGATLVLSAATLLSRAIAGLVPHITREQIAAPSFVVVQVTLAVLVLGVGVGACIVAWLRCRDLNHRAALAAALLGAAGAALLLPCLDILLTGSIQTAARVVGTVEAEIPEDDPRNPADLAALAAGFLSIGSAVTMIFAILASIVSLRNSRTGDIPRIKPFNRHYLLAVTAAITLLTIWYFALPDWQYVAQTATTGHAAAVSSLIVFAISWAAWAILALASVQYVAGMLPLGVHRFSLGIALGALALTLIVFVLLTPEMHRLAAMYRAYFPSGTPHSITTTTSLLAGTNNLVTVSLVFFAVIAQLLREPNGRLLATPSPSPLAVIGMSVLLLGVLFAYNSQVSGAGEIINEVRRQFREVRGIMEGSASSNPTLIVEIAGLNVATIFVPYIVAAQVLFIVLCLLAPSEVSRKLTKQFVLVSICAFALAAPLLLGGTAVEAAVAGSARGSDAHKASRTAHSVGQSIGGNAVAAILIVGFLITLRPLFATRRLSPNSPPSNPNSSSYPESVTVSTMTPSPTPPDIQAPTVTQSSTPRLKRSFNRTEDKKLWFDFAKFFLGTFTVGMISLFVTSNLKDKEVAMLALEKEHLELKMFMSVAEMPLEQRRSFSIYFSTVARDAQLRRVWDNYRKTVESEIATEAEAKRQRRAALIAAIRGMYTGLQTAMKDNPILRQQFLDYVQATLRSQDRDDPAISALLETLSTGAAAGASAPAR